MFCSSFLSFFSIVDVANFCFFCVFFILMFTALFFSGEVCSGIIDTVVKNAGEDEIKTARNITQVLEREVTFTELVVKEYPRDNAVGQRPDPLRRRIVERPRRGLDRVG